MQRFMNHLARAVFLCIFFGAFFGVVEIRSLLASRSIDDETQMYVVASILIATILFLGLYYLWLSHREDNEAT